MTIWQMYCNITVLLDNTVMLFLWGDYLKQDKETRNKLLRSAREEFMEKGYLKASLRNICKNAGVTTGALYFFFQDKEDLFDAVTRETVNAISRIIQSHFEEENDIVASGVSLTPDAMDHQKDFGVAKELLHHMYLHREEVMFILTKCQGTKLENIADVFIETAEKHYRKMADAMQKANPGCIVDDKFIHWLSHEQIDVFIYAITHIEDEEEAMRFISQALVYMMAGWYGLFLKK